MEYEVDWRIRMVELDYVIHRDTDLVDVVWYEIGEAPFRHDCFLGDIVFNVNGVDLGAQWGWIPVFDFALGMRIIADSLQAGTSGLFDFVDSSLTIEFQPLGENVAITAEYATASGTAKIGEFRDAAEDMLARVRQRIEGDYPDLLRNPHYRRVLGQYW